MKKNKTALITGATSGIGKAIAEELAARNYDLVLVSNQQDILPLCQNEFRQKYNINCEPFCCDLAQQSAAKAVFDFCAAKQIEIDVLVNNAGILLFSEVIDAPADSIQLLLNLHIHTPTLLCRFFAGAMCKKRSGYILNVSSISAVMAYPGISLYGPSKTYLRSFSKALRAELKIYGVNVTCLIPGATATALYDPKRINLDLAKKTGIMQSANYVAGKAVAALFARKAECIPGMLNKLTVAILPFLPATIIYQIHKHTQLISKGGKALG